MSTITPFSTVGELVAENIKRVKVFQANTIDFCCGGKATLLEAASRKGLDVQRLIADLQAIDGVADSEEPAWKDATIKEVVDHILATYHQPLRTELPRLHQMAKKVAAVHGDQHPELKELFARYVSFEREMYDHMAKEEQILFPMCVDLESGEDAKGGYCGSVEGPIRVMTMEHDDAASFFATINHLTHQLTPPAEACTTYRALFDGLRELEQEMYLHINLENNVLFPRATAIEASATAH